MIFPKKPQILYAPMLATFGGGSANGFKGGSGPLFDFTSHQFNNAGAYGQLGPTLSMCQTEYSYATWVTDSNFFSMPFQGLQLFTIPETATYSIAANGAYGGPSMVGLNDPGGSVQITGYQVDLEKGEKLLVAVGQRGGQGTNNSGDSGAGGGGATFVCKYVSNSDVTPLVVAAGGNGEAWSGFSVDGPDARTSASWGSTPFWVDSKQYGRAAFGGGFKQDWKLHRLYNSNYPTADLNQAAAQLHYERAGQSLLNSGLTGSGRTSYYTTISSGALTGGNCSGQNRNPSNSLNYSGSQYGFGGFGGGGGSVHEGGGGGGYWGGAPIDTNDYNNAGGNHGGISYVNTTLRKSGTSQTETVTDNNYYRDTFYGDSTEPASGLMGSATLTKL